MEQKQREILQKNVIYLVENLGNFEETCDHLVSDEILTSAMMDSIKHTKPKPSAQIKLLLSFLPQRGITAFNSFIKALYGTSNEEVADHLMEKDGFKSTGHEEMPDKTFDCRVAYTKNRVTIVKGLSNPDEVAHELFKMNIFDTIRLETILQIDEVEKKTREILDQLSHQDQQCVAALHDAFITTENMEFAKCLVPYVRAIENREHKMEPEEWPPRYMEDEEMMRDHVIRIKDEKSPWFIHEYVKKDVYAMQGKCRGKVFIINNLRFHYSTRDRRGSERDGEKLSSLFEELHFTVQQWHNLESKSMKSYLSNAATDLEENTECVILIIMSRGVGTRVLGVDCIPVELKTLTDCFSSAKCPVLHGKPRLVFVQASRIVELATIEKTEHVVKRYELAELECIINADIQILKVLWRKDEKTIIPEKSPHKYRIEKTKSMKSLIVMNVEESDEGTYDCKVFHDTEFRTNPSELKLDVEDDVTASIKKPVYLVESGCEKVDIECIVRTDKPIKEVFWEIEIEDQDRNDKFFIQRDKTMSGKYRLDTSNRDGKISMHSLSINDIKHRDKGKYRCIIKYEDDSTDQSNPTEVKLYDHNTMAFLKDTIHVATPGGQVEIECFLKKESSIVQVFWEKEAEGGKHIIMEKTNPDKYALELSHNNNNRKLIIKNVKISDIGRYRCIVKYVTASISNQTKLELDVKDEYENDVKTKDMLDSKPDQQHFTEDRSPKYTFPDHPSADFLIAYATPEGSQAWLHADVGSWFMNAIVWSFKYHAHEEELHHLLIRVNRSVGTGCTKSNDMTVAEVKSHLRKKFYFFPGIHGNPPELFKD